MASLHDCIQRAIDAKDLNPKQGRAALSEYDQLVDRYAQAMPMRQAEATAAADLKEATRKAARSRRHTVLAQLQAMRRIKHQIETASNPDLAIRDLLEHSETSGHRGETVVSLTNAYTASLRAGLFDALDKVGLNKFGFTKDRITLDAMVRELHGQESGNPLAKQLAEVVRGQQRRFRQLFNAHGGDIGELADYGLPHSHSAEMLIKAGFDDWAAKITPMLDWNRIVDAQTGKPFATAPGGRPYPAAGQRFLKDVYDGIVSGGWDDRAPSMSVGSGALYNRRAEHRVLHFKDGDAWMAYNRDFGASDPFSAMIGGMTGLARDVALMRVLGPNPRAGLEFAIQVGLSRAAKEADPKVAAEVAKRVKAKGSLARTMLHHQSGAASIAENIGMATFFRGTRAFLSSVQLGSAVLSSVSDMATVGRAAKIMGMAPQNVAARTVSLLASGMTRREAARMGYVANALLDAGGGSARYYGEVIGSGIAEKMAGFTMRATGLTHLTDMRRVAFQLEWSAHMAEHADRAFGDLPSHMRQIFEDRGIAAADWDHLRAPEARFVAQDGSDFIAPMHWLEHQAALPRMEAEGLAMRLQMITEEHLERAIPSSSLEGRARLTGETKAGTVIGEIARSVGMYKSFSLSLMLGQYRRMMAMPTPLSRAGYAASLAVPLILTGALAIQLKEMAKGNDPRPMDEEKFWLAALMQSGGLGIFGDFFAAEMSRAGGGVAETLAGPVIGLGGDVIRLVADPVGRLSEGKDLNVGRSVARFFRQNVPFASSAWYVRAAFDRMVADQLQSFLDPEAEEDWRRQQRQRERDYGTRTWWGRGQLAPSRAPDLANMGGQQ